MHGLVFKTSICYWQDQPDYYRALRPRKKILRWLRLGSFLGFESIFQLLRIVLFSPPFRDEKTWRSSVVYFIDLPPTSRSFWAKFTGSEKTRTGFQHSARLQSKSLFKQSEALQLRRRDTCRGQKRLFLHSISLEYRYNNSLFVLG